MFRGGHTPPPKKNIYKGHMPLMPHGSMRLWTSKQLLKYLAAMFLYPSLPFFELSFFVSYDCMSIALFNAIDIFSGFILTKRVAFINC